MRNHEERELESGILQPYDLKSQILGLWSRNGNRSRVENVTQTVTEGVDHESLNPRLREWLKEHHNSPHFSTGLMKSMGIEKSNWEKSALWSKLQHRKMPPLIWDYRYSSPCPIGGLFSSWGIWRLEGDGPKMETRYLLLIGGSSINPSEMTPEEWQKQQEEELNTGPPLGAHTVRQDQHTSSH